MGRLKLLVLAIKLEFLDFTKRNFCKSSIVISWNLCKMSCNVSLNAYKSNYTTYKYFFFNLKRVSEFTMNYFHEQQQQIEMVDIKFDA